MSSVPKQVEGVLGTGKTVAGYDAQGNPIVVADDLGIAKKSFEAQYANTRGDLAKLEESGSNFASALNTFNDPHASPQAILGATLTIVSTITAGAALVAAQSAALAAIVASTYIPVVGAFLIACISVVLIIIELIPPSWYASAGQPQQPTADETIAQGIRPIPANLPLPKGVAEPSLAIMQAMGLLSDILDIESNAPSDWLPQNLGGDAGQLHIDLARVLGNQAGFKEDVYRIAADVVQDPRWRAGQVKSFNLSETQRTGGRGFEIGSTYAKALESFRNIPEGPRPPMVPAFLAPLNSNNTAISLTTESAVEASRNPQVQQVKRGRWQIPRFLPSENKNFDPPGVQPFDVGRYLVIFAVFFSLSYPRQARAATYSAIYLILMQKAWAYKAANREVPEDLYKSMGFMLDLVSQYPLERVETQLAPFTREKGSVSNPLFKDVDWYVKYYLALAPAFSEPIPEIPPTSNTTTSTPPNGPLGQFPGGQPGRSPKISGLANIGADPIANGMTIRSGTYLMEFELLPPYQTINPEVLVQALARFGITSQLLPSQPGSVYRVVAKVARPLRAFSLPRFSWRLLRKL